MKINFILFLLLLNLENSNLNAAAASESETNRAQIHVLRSGLAKINKHPESLKKNRDVLRIELKILDCSPTKDQIVTIRDVILAKIQKIIADKNVSSDDYLAIKNAVNTLIGIKSIDVQLIQDELLRVIVHLSAMDHAAQPTLEMLDLVKFLVDKEPLTFSRREVISNYHRYILTDIFKSDEMERLRDLLSREILGIKFVLRAYQSFTEDVDNTIPEVISAYLTQEGDKLKAEKKEDDGEVRRPASKRRKHPAPKAKPRPQPPRVKYSKQIEEDEADVARRAQQEEEELQRKLLESRELRGGLALSTLTDLGQKASQLLLENKERKAWEVKQLKNTLKELRKARREALEKIDQKRTRKLKTFIDEAADARRSIARAAKENRDEKQLEDVPELPEHIVQRNWLAYQDKISKDDFMIERLIYAVQLGRAHQAVKIVRSGANPYMSFDRKIRPDPRHLLNAANEGPPPEMSPVEIALARGEVGLADTMIALFANRNELFRQHKLRLFEAAEMGCKKVVEDLYEEFRDHSEVNTLILPLEKRLFNIINDLNGEDDTPVNVALRYGHTDFVNLLIDRFPLTYLTHKNRRGKSAADFILVNIKNKHCDVAIHIPTRQDLRLSDFFDIARKSTELKHCSYPGIKALHLLERILRPLSKTITVEKGVYEFKSLLKELVDFEFAR